MLTVKKFGALLDLSYGGYISALLGIAFAIVTIRVIPPDIDLADDADSVSSNATFISTTMAALTGTTEDPEPEDDDEPLPVEERNDEINDSK